MILIVRSLIEVEFNLPAARVVRTLERIAAVRGDPIGTGSAAIKLGAP